MSVKTLCKNCSFQYEPLQCFVGRIDKLKELPGIRVDEIDGHYVIDGKICDWSIPRYWNYLSYDELRDLAWKVRENRILSIPFIVVAQKDNSFSQIADTVRSLQNQQVEPQLIHVLNYTDVSPDRILSLKMGNVPITVEQVYIDDYPERYIHAKTNKFKSIYYGVIQAGFVLPVQFIRKLDQAFNDDMNHFAFMEYEGTEIHSTLLSNEKGGDFIETPDGWSYKDKITAWAKRNFMEHLIQRWENI